MGIRRPRRARGADFAWGDEFNPGGRSMANTWQGNFPLQNLAIDGYERTSPVTTYAPNGYGLCDMIGNVWEWTSDWYSAKHAADATKPCCIPQNPRGGVEAESIDDCNPAIRIPRKVLKGGSYLCAPNYCRRYRPAARHAQPIDTSKNFIVGGNLTAGVDAKADLLFFFPTYTFREPVLGAQAAFGVGWAAGRLRASADVAVAGPSGNTFTGTRTDTVSGGSDLYGLGTLKWHDGNNNYLAYTMFGAPTGAYQLGRLANLSTNHWSIDGGGGYTYFDAQKGHEFSIVGGLTFNGENNDTDYRNGVDGHIDWAASQFLNEQVHIGLVGYFYHHLSGDSGSGATLGDSNHACPP
jgi:hypothetical protein